MIFVWLFLEIGGKSKKSGFGLLSRGLGLIQGRFRVDTFMCGIDLQVSSHVLKAMTLYSTTCQQISTCFHIVASMAESRGPRDHTSIRILFTMVSEIPVILGHRART